MEPTPSPFAQALAENAAWLRRLARAVAHDDAAADDLVQDAFGAALTRRAEIRNLRAFLAGVVRRRSSEVRRGEGRRRERERARVDSTPGVAEGADASAERIETLHALLRELERLPAAQRRVLVQRFFDGLEPAEIAERSGVAPATVRAHLARGLAALRERLDEREHGDGARWRALLAGPALLDRTAPAAATAALPTTLLVGANALAMKTTLALLAGAGIAGALWMADRPRSSKLDSLPIANPAPTTDHELAEIAPPEAARVALAPRDRSAASDPKDSSEARGAGRHRFAGRVVDARTAEAVPELRVFALPEDGGQAIETTTDANGAFAAAAELEVGEVELSFRDESISVVGTQIDFVDGAWIDPRKVAVGRVPFPFEGPQEVHIGPTFRLAKELPRGVAADDLTAAIRLPDAGAWRAPVRAPVREGDRPWIRFPVEATELPGEGPWILEVSAHDGTWFASAPVHRKVGIEPQAIGLELEPRGTVEFEVTAREGVLLTAAAIDVTKRDGTRSERAHLTRAAGGRTAKGSLRLLEAGTYRWSTGPASGEFEVLAADVVHVEIDATPNEPTIDVVVPIDATAIPSIDLSREVFSVIDSASLDRSIPVAPSRSSSGEQGRWEVRLVGLPGGTWSLVPPGGFSRLRWSPGVIDVRPGLEPPTLVARRRGRASRMTIRVVDTTTGLPVANARVGVGPGGGPSYRRHVTEAAGVATTLPVAQDERIHLVVAADGFRTSSRFLVPQTDGADIEVALEPGWSGLARVQRGGRLTPVEGIEVLVDGVSAGRTDADGLVAIEGGGPPVRLELGPGSPAVLRAPPDAQMQDMPAKGWTFLVRDD